VSNYSKADTTTQWFQDDWPGAVMNLTQQTAVLVLHTTEGTSWDTYDGGAKAPTYTARPNLKLCRLDWRAHFPDERSSRALVNLAGGVETNTLNAIQVELVGTCDPAKAKTWNGLKAGVDYIYWPEAPMWALNDLGAFIADLHTRHGLRLQAPTFQAYPGSFGARGVTNTVRMTFDQWRKFTGVCGHQHVPENVHGDPGAIDIDPVLAHARQLVKPQRTTSVNTGTWNLQHGHPVASHVAMVLNAFDAHQLDVLMMQESTDYAAALATASGKLGYKLVMFTDKPGQDQQVTLVRHPEKIQAAWSFPGNKDMWFTKSGGVHAPSYPVAVNLDGTVFLNQHSPVSVNWRKSAPHVPYGPPRRVLAYLQHSRRRALVFKSHPGQPVVDAGDNNATPFDRGYGSPDWIARKTGAHIVAPTQGTGHGIIDFAVVRDAVLRNVKVHLLLTPEAPDHFLVTWVTDTEKRVP
jgi:hypothetical protein